MDELYDDTHITGVDDVTGISSTAMMFDILTKHQEMTIENVKNMYIPANRMGINSSSQKKIWPKISWRRFCLMRFK